MDKDIIDELESFSNLELFWIYYDIKHVLEDKELSDDTVLNTVKELIKGSPINSILYDKLTLYLEKQGYKRETISKKVLDLIRKDKLDWIQSWTTKIHPKYEGKEHVEIGAIWISEKEPKIKYKEDMYQTEKMKKLNELSYGTLTDLQNDIKNILSKREIDTETVSYVIKHLCKIYYDSPWIRYAVLTLFLEEAGFRRDSISRELINMMRKGAFNFSRDWPIERDTPEELIAPIYEGKQYPIVRIYCERKQSF